MFYDNVMNGFSRKGKTDSGITLTEILIALVIIALVIIGVYKAASSAFTKVNTADERDNVQKIMTNMKEFKFQGKYSETNYIQTLIANGAIPASMIADSKGTTAKNIWGGAVTIATSADKYSYSVVETKVPKDSCIGLVNSLRTFSLISKINNTAVDSVSPGTVCAADSNTLTFSTDS
ncbi:prepilin-type N-terminal cleavage/methylation domain-containing protein [Salmonella enterica]|nr:prepilin-type N-terminal cleavage/methylation domain-containing protein [Salmonella enterica]